MILVHVEVEKNIKLVTEQFSVNKKSHLLDGFFVEQIVL
jgi:hypothetical protein